ncbi:MAG: hypothetical protein GF346_05510 [Candidatus Eisenbacteria bacterium]|nr:hypothetical protein [Candidatus Latescibacterota bacterium]MBD3301885.1 hypothetical protein [Candidatus Eisenbacteria bacterium]
MKRSASLLILTVLIVLAQPAAGEYPQIRINTDQTQELQNEQQICINPTDSDNVVACWRDFRLGYRQVGIGYSFDGGESWTDYLIGGELPWDSDPVLIVDDDGTFYLVVINYENGGANQLSVHRSVTGGASWEGPFSAVYSSGATFEDKEWIAVDRSGGAYDGNLYVAWSRFNDVKIMCVTSTDRGETWTDPVRVSDPGHYAQWPVPIALANGDVLIAWDRYYQNAILYDISTDGGATWGSDRTLTTTSTGPQDQINGAITVFPYPSLVVDETSGPRAGWAYCVYPDEAVSADGMDIWCRRSTDNGESWSARVRVNDDPTGLNRDQFHPWVTCDEEGVLTAIWYDRRDDPSNYLWHIYLSRSTDGGTTWEENIRVTDVASSPGDAAAANGPAVETGEPVRLLPAGLIGEYSGVAVREGVTHPVWTDTRNGHQDTYVSIIGPPAAIGDDVRISTRASLRATPNPAQGTAEILLRSPAAASATIEIHDATGRLVRMLPLGSLAAGERRVSFDGRDAAGERLPAGTYFARVTGVPGMEGVRTKLVLLP